MVVTASEAWTVDGIPLNTLAWNISTKGGNRYSPPPMRGEGTVIPYKPGSIWYPKVPDERIITLNMWVQGSDEDGKVPTTESAYARYDRNYRMLMKLLWNPNQQMALGKTFRDYDAGVNRTVTAQAQYNGGLEPTMTGAARATMSVDLLLSDPFFYGSPQVINFSSGASVNASPNILGDYYTDAILIDFNGARNNMRLTNNTEGIWVNVNDNISSGQDVFVDVAAFTAMRGATSVTGKVTHFGSPFWMLLRNGPQNLNMSSSSGTGAASTVTYYPKWI